MLWCRGPSSCCSALLSCFQRQRTLHTLCKEPLLDAVSSCLAATIAGRSTGFVETGPAPSVGCSQLLSCFQQLTPLCCCAEGPAAQAQGGTAVAKLGTQGSLSATSNRANRRPATAGLPGEQLNQHAAACGPMWHPSHCLQVWSASILCAFEHSKASKPVVTPPCGSAGLLKTSSGCLHRADARPASATDQLLQVSLPHPVSQRLSPAVLSNGCCVSMPHAGSPGRHPARLTRTAAHCPVAHAAPPKCSCPSSVPAPPSLKQC